MTIGNGTLKKILQIQTNIVHATSMLATSCFDRYALDCMATLGQNSEISMVNFRLFYN